MLRLIISLFLVAVAYEVESHGLRSTKSNYRNYVQMSINNKSRQPKSYIHSTLLRIIGGERVPIEEHPYQVSVQWRNSHVCGGTIISRIFVLTAAHCLNENKSHYTIQAGSSNLSAGGRIYSVATLIKHKSYDPKSKDNDIALIKILGIFSFRRKIKPVTLAAQNQITTPGTMATVLGWGIAEQNGRPSHFLLKAKIPIVSLSQCKATYANMSYRKICAGNEKGGKDSCQGDSGGPLLIGRTQIGIVSYGKGCGEPNTPGVYTRVAAYREWITQNSRV